MRGEAQGNVPVLGVPQRVTGAEGLFAGAKLLGTATAISAVAVIALAGVGVTFP